MKKQLFIFVLLAFFAGITNVSAQNCSPGALSPVAGQPYNYQVTISGTGYNNGTGLYTWYVTTLTNLLDPSGIVPDDGTMFASVGASYGIPTLAVNPLTLTWTTAAINSGSTFYLVVKYSETATGNSCTAMNMKVWEIKPINKFLLAVNSFSGAVGQSGVFCAGAITGAQVTPGASPTVQYTYGSTIMYAEVTASNYTGQWLPSFQITGLQGDQAITSVTWDAAQGGAYTNTTTFAAGAYTSNSLATAAYSGAAKLYVKVEIANNNYESLSDATIKIAVDGIIPGPPALNDVKSDTDCSPEIDFGKFVNQTIKARPTIAPDGGILFITKTP